MATSAKAKPAAKGAEAVEAPKKSKKMLIIVILLAVLLLIVAGGAAAFFLMGSKAKAGGGEAEHAAAAPSGEAAKAPVFVNIEPYVVNLQQENGDQFLQVSITLQVADEGTAEALKTFMPLVRSRLLLALSSKKASELLTVDGKKKLTDEIIASLNQPFAA